MLVQKLLLQEVLFFSVELQGMMSVINRGIKKVDIRKKLSKWNLQDGVDGIL